MPRYEFVEGNSQKFWEIELQGAGFTVKWGRLGTGGQAKDHVFADEGTAQHEYEQLVRSKEKKGYQLVRAAEGPAEEDRTVACQLDDRRNCQEQREAQAKRHEDHRKVDRALYALQRRQEQAIAHLDAAEAPEAARSAPEPIRTTASAARGTGRQTW